LNSNQFGSGGSEQGKLYDPNTDDLIAFYFYDVVNQRYIPFRATIKGLTETNTATWDELSFIGRADRLYSYGGFNRNLSFGFNVVISSIVELVPTWQRINYLSSLIKPSRYTVSKYSEFAQYNNFIVPPMVMVTIGDLFKDQPIILNSVSVMVPDNGTWETLNEDNSNKWSYLANIIQSDKVENKYGQLPKEVEINVTCYLLEKERARVGASHYGHAPRTDDYLEDQFRTTDPTNQEPTEMHKALTVYNK
jgi:hypothetical protein